MGEVVIYPRKFFVRVEHIPTGITVSKMSSSQLKAKEKCMQELEELVSQYDNQNKFDFEERTIANEETSKA